MLLDGQDIPLAEPGDAPLKGHHQGLAQAGDALPAEPGHSSFGLFRLRKFFLMFSQIHLAATPTHLSRLCQTANVKKIFLRERTRNVNNDGRIRLGTHLALTAATPTALRSPALSTDGGEVEDLGIEFGNRPKSSVPIRLL